MEEWKNDISSTTHPDPKRQLNYLIEQHQKQINQFPQMALSVSPQSDFSEALSNQVEVNSECDERAFDFAGEDNKDEYVLQAEEDVESNFEPNKI